jgi:TolB protein
MTVGRCTHLALARLGVGNLVATLAFGACSSGSDVVEPGQNVGTLKVVITTTGQDLDADGYLVALDQGEPQAVALADSLTFSALSEGDHELALSGVAANCSLGPPNPRTLQIVSGGKVETTFEVTCTTHTPETGEIRVSTATTGTPRHDAGYSGYEVWIDESSPAEIQANDTKTFGGLTPGPHTVLLAHIPQNCLMESENPQSVLLGVGSVVVRYFLLTCYEAPPPPPGSLHGRIVFASIRDGNRDIYVMNADGTETLRLTTDPSGEGDPAWSPDGSRVAFWSDRDGNREIYLMDADGTNATRLTDRPEDDSPVSWSPDGKRLVFGSTGPDGSDIYVINVDGSGLVNLTNDPAVVDEIPRWSPDGTKIAFNSERDGGMDIFVMNSDGSNLQNLTNGPEPDVSDAAPAWSPDGTRIAFASDRDNGYWDVYVMDADGSNQRNLTHHPTIDFGPAWSPDGEAIAFTAFRDGGEEIYVMALDGSAVYNLTHNDPEIPDGTPSWRE